MSVTVNLANRSYEIHIQNGLLTESAAIVNKLKPSQIIIVTHPCLMNYANVIKNNKNEEDIPCHLISVPSGERSKKLKNLYKLYQKFAELQADRKTVVIALGGGVIGDLTGFAAATYMRGVQLIQFPTTLLAQVDAAIGGKTAVDLPQGKNLVGTTYQPKVVLIDPNVLETLPKRQLKNAMAEVIKYGLIMDKNFYNSLSVQMGSLYKPKYDYSEIISKCCELKAKIVAEDEFDLNGTRAILNFGHTIGHAIERALNFSKILHGEAVSIGMLAAANLGAQMNVTPPEIPSKIEKILISAGLPTKIPKSISASELINACLMDKKTEKGKLRFVLLEQIGKSRLYNDIPIEILKTSLTELE